MEVQALAARVLRAVALVTRLAMGHLHRQGVPDALQVVQADVPAPVAVGAQVLVAPVAPAAVLDLAAVVVLRIAQGIVKIAVVDAVALVREIAKLHVQAVPVLVVALVGLVAIPVVNPLAKVIALAAVNNTVLF